MNIILITDTDPVDSWVASQIAQQFPVSQVLLPGESVNHHPKHLGERLRTEPLKLVSAIPRELFIRWFDRQRQQYMVEHLWDGDAPGIAHTLAPTLEVPIDQFNGPENASQIQTLSPDLIITCGGPILQETIFGIPRLGCMNVQFGISDAYRGQHTLFWPMAIADWDNVGATIHHIDHGVNTGDIVAQVYPGLCAEDHEFSIEVKTARIMVKALLELLSQLDHQPSLQGLEARANAAEGKYILFRDRTLQQELGYRFRRLVGRAPMPTRESSIVF